MFGLVMTGQVRRPYEQFSDVLQDHFCTLTGSQTLDIEISGQYEQISDEL